MTLLTDTHCHLNLLNFENDIETVIESAVQAGIERILVPGVDIKSSIDAVELSQRYKGLIFAAIGVHPNSKEDFTTHSLSTLEDLAKSDSVVAIGEIGLDFYRNVYPAEIQLERLQIQLELASRLNLPIILHNRNSEEELLHILTSWYSIYLKENKNPLSGMGALHSFYGSQMVSDKLLKMNFYIGVGGPLTFHKNESYRNFVSSIPLERLIIETDSPYLSPHPFRGQRNEPAYVQFVSKKLSTIFQKEEKEINRITFDNSKQLFKW